MQPHNNWVNYFGVLRFYSCNPLTDRRILLYGLFRSSSTWAKNVKKSHSLFWQFFQIFYIIFFDLNRVVPIIVTVWCIQIFSQFTKCKLKKNLNGTTKRIVVNALAHESGCLQIQVSSCWFLVQIYRTFFFHLFISF